MTEWKAVIDHRTTKLGVMVSNLGQLKNHDFQYQGCQQVLQQMVVFEQQEVKMREMDKYDHLVTISI